MIERQMSTPATAWHNGVILREVGFTARDVENYRAVYCKVFDWPGKAARYAKTGSLAIQMAVEDAELDRMAMGVQT